MSHGPLAVLLMLGCIIPALLAVYIRQNRGLLRLILWLAWVAVVCLSVWMWQYAIEDTSLLLGQVKLWGLGALFIDFTTFALACDQLNSSAITSSSTAETSSEAAGRFFPLGG